MELTHIMSLFKPLFIILCRKQIRGFMKYFSVSFLWAFFQWFFTGKLNCGFSQFPTFGLQAWKNSFFFDFSLTYVGTGMICPHIVNLSLLFGAVLSWGIMYPLFKTLKGEWFPADIDEGSMRSLNGYKVFLSISLLLGDGLYNFVKITCITLMSLYKLLKGKNLGQVRDIQNTTISDDSRKDEIFVRESIPMWIGVVGYIALAIISAIALPAMFHELKWHYIILCYIIVPSLAFCNAYGAGLTDMNMAYNYGKVGLFAIAAMAGKENGVVAGLLACGLVKSVVNISCVLMQDFKTGHLTLTSPRTMFVSQAIGTVIGCIVAPLSFSLFYKVFDIGNPNGEYKAPYAIIYRNLAIISVEGLSALPEHCLELCYGFFAFAVGMNVMKDMVPERIGKWFPMPMAMAVPFLIGANPTIDMCIGSLVVFLWHRMDSSKAKLMIPAVASGLICGEGLWILPASLLALVKVTPPICMTFLPA
ncbi:transporter [Lithospermum erythrorhizon]|uniref:Transporter n=1 Tax=Lithospermum erythrorhizon TaxID=34254 RepID=A0AAV3REP8_LITER